VTIRKGHPYDQYAEAYRDWWGPVIAPAAISLLDRLGPRFSGDAELEILDVGTGTGTLLLAALERWPRARGMGVDPAERMLDLARAAAAQRDGVADRMRTAVGAAGDLPVADASFDLAISSFVIQLVPSRAAAVREMARVLRPGGTAAIVTWQAEHEPFPPDEAFEDAAWELRITLPEISSDARPYASPAAAAAELRRAGLTRVTARTEWLEHRYTPESYAGVLEHWIEDDLFRGLRWDKRRRLRTRLLSKLRGIDREALVWRRPLVSVIGQRPI
jgi:ubiquinone/menaquinone biosynthesis C-methylase UbiE